MIVDHIDNWRLYRSAHALFQTAFNCLVQTDWSKIDNGRFEIDGEDVFAIVDRRRGKGLNDAILEIHRQYIDIQFLFRGSDVMGYRPLSDCSQHDSFNSFDSFNTFNTFDKDLDVGFLSDRPTTWFDVKENCFSVFYPTDAHAPMGTENDFHKVVVKVRA